MLKAHVLRYVEVRGFYVEKTSDRRRVRGTHACCLGILCDCIYILYKQRLYVSKVTRANVFQVMLKQKKEKIIRCRLRVDLALPLQRGFWGQSVFRRLQCKRRFQR